MTFGYARNKCFEGIVIPVTSIIFISTTTLDE